MKLMLTTMTGATGAFALPGCLDAAVVAGARLRPVAGVRAAAFAVAAFSRDAAAVPTPVLVRRGGDDG